MNIRVWHGWAWLGMAWHCLAKCAQNMHKWYSLIINALCIAIYRTNTWHTWLPLISAWADRWQPKPGQSFQIVQCEATRGVSRPGTRSNTRGKKQLLFYNLTCLSFFWRSKKMLYRLVFLAVLTITAEYTLASPWLAWEACWHVDM